MKKGRPVVFWGMLITVLDSVMLTKINVLEHGDVVAILVEEYAGELDRAISQLEQLHIKHKVASISGSRESKAIVFDGCRWDEKGRLVAR